MIIEQGSKRMKIKKDFIDQLQEKCQKIFINDKH
jgi:hypothetical protein